MTVSDCVYPVPYSARFYLAVKGLPMSVGTMDELLLDELEGPLISRETDN
jgi:hypothetical protein